MSGTLAAKEKRMETDPVLVEDAGGVLVITINRPKARNAVTAAVAEGVAAALDDLDKRDDLVVGIITGAGGTFCAGMDLKGFLRGEQPSVPGRGFAGLTEASPRSRATPWPAAARSSWPATWWWPPGARSSASRRPSGGWPRRRAGCCACRSGSARTSPWNSP
jgi:hypothetical protein